MTDSFINSIEYKIFDQNALDQIAKAKKEKTASFSEKAKLYGLDPKVDFQYGDFSGVSFTNADLRNYNFTGCNLSNTTGVNFRIDETTNFSKCDLENSPFAYGVEKQKLLKNKQTNKEYIQIMNGDVFARSSFVLSGLDSKDMQNLAKMVLHDDTSTVTQSSALVAMADFIKSDSEFLEYAKSILHYRFDSASILKSLFRAIASKYSKNKEATLILFQMISDSRAEVALAALANLKTLTDTQIVQVAETVLGDRWEPHRRLLCMQNGSKYKPYRIVDKVGFFEGLYSEKEMMQCFLDPIIPLTEDKLADIYFLSEDDLLIKSFNDKHFLGKLKNRDKYSAEQISRRLEDFPRKTRMEGRRGAGERYFKDVYLRSNIKYLMGYSMLNEFDLKQTYNEEKPSMGLKMPRLFNKINSASSKVQDSTYRTN
ncbi:MAG: hypothetical protein COA43_05990 [Robiginitomaculum sp.]|nr:MAG: hypothetical protein COA43_05990 [Robiginitomaculum sp.]